MYTTKPFPILSSATYTLKGRPASCSESDCTPRGTHPAQHRLPDAHNSEVVVPDPPEQPQLENRRGAAGSALRAPMRAPGGRL